MRVLRWTPVAFGAALVLTGCHTDMWTQPKVTPFDEDDIGVFNGTTTARKAPDGTVARGWEKLDDAKYTGIENNAFVSGFPSELKLDGKILNTKTDLAVVLKRGKERFHIYCSHCHGESGDGKGMIAQRGFVLRRMPATYHTDRLRNMPNGYFYDVITNGYGIMYSQASRVKPDDRWAVIAYIRALQLSQNVKASQMTTTDMDNLNKQLSGANEPKDTGHGGGH